MYRNTSDILLSKREIETVRCLIQGDTQQQIAKKLGISRKTVNQYCAELRKKTNTKSTIAAVVVVIKTSNI